MCATNRRGGRKTQKEKEQKGKILNQEVIKSCKGQVNFQSITL